MNSFHRGRSFAAFRTDTLAAAEEAKEAGKDKKHQHLMRKIQNLQNALLKVAIRESDFQVEKLEGDALGKVENGKASVDEVALNDYETLVHTLAHEQVHLEGVEDDAVAELIVEQRHNTDPMYKDKVAKLMPIIQTVGKELSLKLCIEKNYSELFNRYKHVSIQHGMKQEEIEKIFFTAFPYHRLKKEAK